MTEPSPHDLRALLADQRRRAALGESFRVESYCQTYPALRDDAESLLDLIYNEVVLREGRGESPILSEYAARFPELAGPLADLFEVHRAIDAADTLATADDEGVAETVDLPPGATPPAAPSRSPADSHWPVLDGYEVTGILGSGGMGVVYRARDLRRGVTVAIKTMRQVDAAAIYRFKQEFRTILDVSHPNLVTLHELISDGRSWYIVMECVEGKDFLDYVRQDQPLEARGETSTESVWVLPGPGAGDGDSDGDGNGNGNEDEASVYIPAAPMVKGLSPEAQGRLQRVLRQLAEGLAALHEVGKLHRDIKPSNVLVTDAGRVVLMDFGLATEQTRVGRDLSTEGQLVGSAGYMAPEQAAGLRLTPATDWYSVGVMLYEALTGRLPFLGGMLEVLMDKQRFEPPPPHELAADVPDDLDALCVDLLRRDPAARPSGATVLVRLGAPAGSRVEGESAANTRSSPSHGSEVHFVGRVVQLRALEDALAGVLEGRTVVVFVRGRSGVGKTALVQTFVDGPAARAGAVVLAGRCYERESVPYKGLDSLIDALARHLRRLSGPEARELLPRDVSALARVFPVLRRVDAVAAAPRRGAEVPDPQELRRRAYAALRELLGRLGDRRPLVLAIDDLQWGDTDSLAVLAEILRPPDPPVLLLLGCFRSEEAETNPLLLALRGGPDAPTLDRRELEVGPLPPEDACTLAKHWLGAAGPEAERQAEALARESGGNPLFVAELARSVAGGSPGSNEATGPGGRLTLDAVLWSRVLRLPDDARRLLEVVAVAGGPVRPALAWQCLDRGGDERAIVSTLRAGRLVRTAGGDGERVETYHDRVRETVVAHIGPAWLSDYHLRLARALEAAGRADPEVLGAHWLEGGEPERAGEHYARAAAMAAEALAFDRAAALYRVALELLDPAGGEGRRLRAALGAALASAGRGSEAACAYLAACDGATVAEALEFRRQAAMQFLISGHIDEGLSALHDVLGAVGMTLPRTPRQALVSLLLRRARLRIRGLGFRPRDTSEVAAADLTRVDVCWSAAVGLSNVDWARGADFQARGLLLALRAGEPSRVARALAVEAAQTATGGVACRRRTALLLDRAGDLATRSGDPYAQGMVTLAQGVSAYLEGRWRDALAASDAAETVFRDRCTGVAWELDTAHAYALWALSHLGEWAELARRFPRLIAEARERGDLYAAMNLSTYVLSIVRLAADDPASAREEVERVAGQWSRDGYHVQHNDQVWAMTQIDLYTGEGPAAWERVSRHWPTLARSLLLRVQFIRVAMLGLRARCALAAAAPARDPSVGPWLRSARRDADRLDREGLPWAAAQAWTVRAGRAALLGHRAEAADHLRRAAAAYREADMALAAAVADLRLGEAQGGPEGQALRDHAVAWLTAQSIRRPDRVADLFAPGFATDTGHTQGS